VTSNHVHAHKQNYRIQTPRVLNLSTVISGDWRILLSQNLLNLCMLSIRKSAFWHKSGVSEETHATACFGNLASRHLSQSKAQTHALPLKPVRALQWAIPVPSDETACSATCIRDTCWALLTFGIRRLYRRHDVPHYLISCIPLSISPEPKFAPANYFPVFLPSNQQTKLTFYS
jgi:hypothetical protein